MKVKAFGRAGILSATLALGFILAGGASLMYFGTVRDKSAFQSHDPVNDVSKVKTIAEDKPVLETQKEATQPVNENSVTVTAENVDCDKNTSENTSEEDNVSINTTKTTVNCNKTEDDKSSSVNIESSMSQTSQSSSSSTGSSGSASNSSNTEITVNQ